MSDEIYSQLTLMKDKSRKDINVIWLFLNTNHCHDAAINKKENYKYVWDIR